MTTAGPLINFDMLSTLTEEAILDNVSNLTPGQARPRRADARHNAAAILQAATRILAERPDAGLAEIAKTAGISRQTVYAHFPSRDALINALVDRATERVGAALDAADLDSGPATEALVRLMEVGWQTFDADPFLLHLSTPLVSPQEDRDRHAPITRRMRPIMSERESASE